MYKASSALTALVVIGAIWVMVQWYSDTAQPAGEIVAKRNVPPSAVYYVEKKTCRKPLDPDGFCVDPDARRIPETDTWAVPARTPGCFAFDIRDNDGTVTTTCVEQWEWDCYQERDRFDPQAGTCPPGRTTPTATSSPEVSK
jgi:hypothetical protein